jgi:hypothetical protein
LGNARDALFELTDAVLVTPATPSLPHLSLASVLRRRWRFGGGYLCAALPLSTMQSVRNKL